MNDSDLERLVANLAWRAPTPALDERVRDTLRTATIRAGRVRTTLAYAAASMLAASLLMAAFLAISRGPSGRRGDGSMAGVVPATPSSDDDATSTDGGAGPAPSAPNAPVVTPHGWNRIAGVGKTPLATVASLGDPSLLAASAATLERFEPLLPPALSVAVASINAIYGPMSDRGPAPAE